MATIVAESGGDRLDVYLASATGKTRSQIKAMSDGGNVTVNGEKVKCGYMVRIGDVIELTEIEREIYAAPEDIPLDVLYEDEHIAVINKQQGISVHPGAGNKSGTLVNALLYRFGKLSGTGGELRPGIVHRLDKDTSGVLIVAKNDSAHLNLSNQLSRREMHKIYVAVLEGNLKDDSGEVRTYIGRSPRDRKKMAVLSSGKEAITQYRVLERFGKNCLVEFDIKTGRTHQIRVHAQHLGHPVVGDKTYGFSKQKFDLDGQLLHAKSITFRHPVTNENMTVSAPLPDYFNRVLEVLRKEK